MTTPTTSTIRIWTEESHQNDLKNGTMVFEKNEDRLGRPSMYIKNMKSDASRFGIACMRHIVSKSLELGMNGRVHNDASWSSHLFHLKMGMIPLNNNPSFVRHCFGGLSLRALQNYEMINLALSKGDSLLPDQITTLNKIKKIVYVWKQLNSQYNKEEPYTTTLVNKLKESVEIDKIADAELIGISSTIEIIKNEKINTIKSEFVPDLLDILELHKGRSGPPDTSSLYSVNMVLSDIGIKRWKHVIAEKIAFTPFRNLEPLREMMTPKQIERLDALNS